MTALPSTQRRYDVIIDDVDEFAKKNVGTVGVSFADFISDYPESERTVQRALASRGTSWHKVLTSARMDEAQFLLAHTDLSASVIAVRCGYKTNTLFNDVFKSENNKTPVEYRDEQRT